MDNAGVRQAFFFFNENEIRANVFPMINGKAALVLTDARTD